MCQNVISSSTRAANKVRKLLPVALFSVLITIGNAIIHPAPTVTAASGAFGGSFLASNTVDQTAAEYLSSYDGDSTSIDFDFGTARTVDGYVNVTLADPQRRVESCRLIFDTDGVDGFNATTDTVRNFSSERIGTQGAGYINRFAPVTARKVSWEVVTSSGNDARLGMAEIAFMNTASGSIPIPSAFIRVNAAATPFSASFAAANASNDIAGVGYLSGVEYASQGQGTNAYLDFDMGSARSITGFDFFDRLFAGDRTNSFDLIFSNDSNFNGVIARRTYSKSSTWTASDSFSPISARYVRIDVTAAAAGSNAGVGEMVFYEAFTPPNQAPSFALPSPGAPLGNSWTSLPAVLDYWNSVSASADGSKMIIASTTEQIYYSDNSGDSWVHRPYLASNSNPNFNVAILGTAMAADASVIYAVAQYLPAGEHGAAIPGVIIASHDRGVSWSVLSSSNTYWSSIACTPDGSKLIVASRDGYIFTSTNMGASFGGHFTSLRRHWADVAISADGTKLVAAQFNGSIWTSSDSGGTWVQRAAAGTRPWTSLASSADGNILAACVWPGKIYTSQDAGATWGEKITDADRNWRAVTVSEDGSAQAAGEISGKVWLSTDSGNVWTLSNGSNTSNWVDLAFNRIGEARFLAAASNSGIIQKTTGSTGPYTVVSPYGSGAFTMNNFASTISAGPSEASQTVSFIVTNTNNALFTVQPSISSNGTLSFTPALATGKATVTVRAQDNGGTNGGGVDTSAPQTFVITIPADSAGAWSTAAWLNDGSSGVVPGQTIWASNFGTSSSTIINGFNVAGLAALPASNANFDLTGHDQVFPNDTNDLTNESGGSSIVAQSFFWGALDNSLTLKNLTIGEKYVCTLLTVGWDDTASARVANMISGSDLLSVDLNQFGNNKGMRVEYSFTANATTRRIDVRSTTPSNSFHLYGAMLRLDGISNNRAPTNIVLSGDVINENEPNALVGSLTASDLDASQTHSFELVSGLGSDHNADYYVDLQGNLRNRNGANYETGELGAVRVNRVRIRATDNGFPSQTFEKAFTIYINNVNEPPTEIRLTNYTVAENSPIGTVVGTLSQWGDPENGSGHSFLLVPGAGSQDNGLFGILSGNFKELVIGEIPDFEVKPTYSIRVRVLDTGGAFFEQILTITVNNGNDFPQISALAEQTINEDTQNWVIPFTISDIETNASLLTVSVSSSNATLFPASSLVLGGSAGNRTLTVTPVTNLSGSATITLNVGDGTNTTMRTFLLTVLAVNDAPSFAVVPSVQQYFGDVSTIPNIAHSMNAGPQETQTVSFTISNNTNPSMFSVQPTIDSSGTLRFTPATAGTATISVRAMDNGGVANGGADTSAPQNITITLFDAVSPSDITLTSASVQENAPVGTLVGTLGVIDSNPSEIHTFRFVQPPVGQLPTHDNSRFTITGTRLETATNLNHEESSTRVVWVEVTDNGRPARSFIKQFVINITNVNEAPLTISGPTAILENRGANVLVGVISATDDDLGQAHRFTLVTGTGSDDNALFKIDAGEIVPGTDETDTEPRLENKLSLLANADYETKMTYSIRVRATDNGIPALFTERIFIIDVRNANDAPHDILLSRTSIPESFDTESSVPVSLMTAIDQDSNQTHVFSLPSTDNSYDNSSFYIQNNSLFHRPIRNTAFRLDFETKPTYKIRLAVTDSGYINQFGRVEGQKTFSKDIIIQLTDVPERLEFFQLTASQRPGSKKVDISYVLSDDDLDSAVPVSLEVSSDGGNTWTIPVSSATGHIGISVQPGREERGKSIFVTALRSIVWDAGVNWNEQNSANVRVRVTAGGLVQESSNFPLDTRGDGNLAITGRVVSRTTKLPLNGATIQIGTRTITTSADGSFRLNNTANGELNISLNQFLTVTRTINAPQQILELSLGNIELRPDTSDPVVDLATPDVKGMIIHGFKVQTPLRIKVEWGNGSPGQVIVRRTNSSSATPVVVATLTGPGPEYVTPSFDIDSSFSPTFTPNMNSFTVEAVNSLGVRSAIETVKMAVIPLPEKLAKLKPTAPNAVLQFPPQQIPGQPTKPLNHLGFDYGSYEEEMIVKVPEVGNFGFSFGCGGAFDYTISDGNWENAFMIGDIELFGTQFRHSKQFSRPGNAYDVDAERPTLEVYLGDRTIQGSVIASERGTASATGGFSPNRVQAALAVQFDDKLGEIYTVDLVPPLKGLPKKIKKIFGNVVLYGQVGLNGSGTVAIGETPGDPRPRIIDGTVGGALGLKAALEIDVWVAEASVYVGGISNVTFGHPAPLLRNASIRFYAGYTIDSWFYDRKGQVTIGEWSYVAPGTRSSRSLGNYGNILSGGELSPWQPMERQWRLSGDESFLHNIPVSTGARGTRSTTSTSVSSELAAFNRLGVTRKLRSIPSDPNLPAQATLPLLNNVFPKAKPSLAEYNGKLMLTYVRDTGATNPVQFTEVAFTYYDGTTWTTPGPIATDARGQFDPQVAFDGNGNAVAVWSRVKDASFTGGVGPEDMSPLLELVTSRWSATTQTWSPARVLTNNAVLDHKPILSNPLTDGDLMLGWVRNSANEVGGFGAQGDLTNDQLLTARWDTATETWGSEVVVNSTVTNTKSVVFAARGDKAAFVWNQDMDGDFDTAADGELFAQEWNGSTWSAAQRVTNDAINDSFAQVAISPNGTVYTLWVSGTDLVMQNNFAGVRSIVRPDSQDNGFADCSLTVANNGLVIALWQAMSQTGPDAYYRVYDPATATWGLDDQLSRDASIEKSFSTVWDAAGNLVIAYNNVAMVKTNKTVTLNDGSTQIIEDVLTPSTNDLLIARRRIINDLGFVPDSIKAVGDSFLPGASVTLQATVKNTGNLPVQDVKVAFYLGNPTAGGTVIGTITTPGLLKATEERLVEQLWTIPTDLSGTIQIFAVVDPLAEVSEFSETNNQLLFETAGQDLQLRFIDSTPLRDRSFTVRTRVFNTGSTFSPVTDLKLWDDFTEDATPLTAATVSRLAPGESVDIVISVPPGNFQGGDKPYYMILNEAGRVGEITPSDNQSSFMLSLFIDDDGDGIPAEWEQANNMSDNNANDGKLDSDEDGFSDGAEYLAGTNPRDRDSVLRVGEFHVIPVVGGQGHVFTISWASVAGKSYVVERSNDLNEWTAIATGVTATAPLNTYTDEVSTAGKAFYRVRPQ